MGRMILTALGMVAEMELGFMRDRQRAGVDAAKAKGVYKGRPVTFDRTRIVALCKEWARQRSRRLSVLSGGTPIKRLKPQG
jgi:DNA invertase Pin-like site-specific DNA recombinase